MQTVIQANNKKLANNSFDNIGIHRLLVLVTASKGVGRQIFFGEHPVQDVVHHLCWCCFASSPAERLLHSILQCLKYQTTKVLNNCKVKCFFYYNQATVISNSYGTIHNFYS